jgi:hypothetical protein
MARERISRMGAVWFTTIESSDVSQAAKFRNTFLIGAT